MAEITTLVQTAGTAMRDIWSAGGKMIACAIGSLLFVYKKQGANDRKKTDYENVIVDAKEKGELIDIIIAFSQDTALPWATFRKYYNQAHLRI